MHVSSRIKRNNGIYFVPNYKLIVNVKTPLTLIKYYNICLIKYKENKSDILLNATKNYLYYLKKYKKS